MRLPRSPPTFATDVFRPTRRPSSDGDGLVTPAAWRRRGQTRRGHADVAKNRLCADDGALHRGHVALLEESRHQGEPLALSIFVNPTQFAPNEDLERYPRDLTGDLAHGRRRAACDVIFVPERRRCPLRANRDPRSRFTTSEQGMCGAVRPRTFRRRRDRGLQAVQHRAISSEGLACAGGLQAGFNTGRTSRSSARRTFSSWR